MKRREKKKMDKDKQFELIQNFVNNMKDKRTGTSSVYLFELSDRDGNVVDVKYGMNLLTNNGFNAVFKNTNSFALSDSVKLYVGSGVSNFDKTTAFIETPLFGGLAATNSNTGKDYAYPIMFSRGQESDTGIITLISRFGIVYYDYNISNYDTDTLVTEYGIGTAYNALWTHSHIYNDRGEKASITKKSNYKLTIYIYMCLSLYEHVIMSNWANDIHMAITTNAVMFQRMFESNLYTYKKGNVLYDRTSGRTQTQDDTIHPEDESAGIDSIIRNTTVVPGFTLWSQKGSDSAYIDGFVSKAGGLIIISPEYMTPETFNLTGFTSADYTRPTGFVDKIGKNITDDTYDKNVYPPFTTMMNVSVNTFNRHTGQWDNPCPFINDNNAQYSNPGLETNYCLPIYYFSNGRIQTGYLYQNLYTNNPILSINHGHNQLYACDKYWDQSSWINITDFDNLPVAARTARYWISDSNSLGIVPTRQIQTFELLESAGGTNGYHNYQQSAFNALHEGCKPYLDMSDQNCLVIGGRICAINRLRSYTFTTSEGTNSAYEMYHMGYGRWLLSFRNIGSNQIHAIDVSTLNDPEPDTSAVNGVRTLEFTSTVNTYSGVYRTDTGTGYVCVQALSTDEAIILNLRGSTITSTLYQWKSSCCIHGTNLVAYIPVSDPTYIHIFDLALSADTAVIQSPLANIPNAMFGNNSHLWMYDGTDTYHIDLSSSTRTPELCNNINFASRANSYRLNFEYVDDVTMIYDTRTSNVTLSDVYYIVHDNPTVIRNMSAFGTSEGIFGTINHCICQLRYVNGHTLIADIQIGDDNMSPIRSRGTKLHICDLGRYIAAGEVWVYYNRWYTPSNGFNGAYLYGQSVMYDTYYLFPVTNMLQLKVTGETKTITAFNHTKRISGKAFTLGYTNMPLWGYEINGSGKPPGSPAPTLTDGDGKILEWG